MKVIIACEFSGIVRDAFIREGHDAISVDLLPSERPGPHIQDDILHYLNCDNCDSDFDLMIAHPPCTYLTNAGVRHLHSIPSRKGKLPTVHGEERYQAMVKSAMFFNDLMNMPIKRVAVENPIPHKYAKFYIGQYTQLIQPWQFGHGETKATCLWLKNLPNLIPTKIMMERKPRAHNEPPSPDRWKNRSRTFEGIAEAMAKQWGQLDKQDK